MKIRKSVKYSSIVISVILFIASIFGIVNSIMNQPNISNSKEIYVYGNKFNYNYSVNIKKNKYIDEVTLNMDQKSYITDLIDNINLKLNYEYEGNTSSKIDYKYSIIGKISAVYSKDGIESKVWQKDYILKEENLKTKTANKININEDIVLNLDEQNKLVKDFENEMGMTLDAKYILTLVVETNTNIEGVDIPNKYSKDIIIDLAQKTTNVSGDNNLENKEYISKKYEKAINVSMPGLIINIIILIFSFILFIKVIGREPINIVKNEYRQELNKILKICQDKVVKVSSNPSVGKENIIDVKDFGELIKVSEELFKPVLYWYSDEDEEAHFYVVSSDIIYRYIFEKFN